MKTNHSIINKGVSFNLYDPDQKKMYDHAMKRSNFSAYVKRLIQRDIEGVRQVSTVHETIAEPKGEVSFNTDLMGGLI